MLTGEEFHIIGWSSCGYCFCAIMWCKLSEAHYVFRLFTMYALYFIFIERYLNIVNQFQNKGDVSILRQRKMDFVSYLTSLEELRPTSFYYVHLLCCRQWNSCFYLIIFLSKNQLAYLSIIVSLQSGIICVLVDVLLKTEIYSNYVQVYTNSKS